MRDYVDKILPSYGLSPIDDGASLADYLSTVSPQGHDAQTGAATSQHGIQINRDAQQSSLDKYGQLRDAAILLVGWDCSRLDAKK